MVNWYALNSTYNDTTMKPICPGHNPLHVTNS